jgi:hypothetical protein
LFKGYQHITDIKATDVILHAHVTHDESWKNVTNIKVADGESANTPDKPKRLPLARLVVAPSEPTEHNACPMPTANS